MTKLAWIERYDVPSAKSEAGWLEGWATIHVDSSGFLGIVSDFGNYAFAWTSFGDDFKRFLGQIDWDYLHTKLMSGKDRFIYDGEATLKAIRACIAQLDDSTRERELDLLEDHDLYEEDEGFVEWAQESQLDDPWSCRRTTHEPQCRRFCQETWPRFVELLKAGSCSPMLPRHVAVHADHGSGVGG